jgi:hypothetical protein
MKSAVAEIVSLAALVVWLAAIPPRLRAQAHTRSVDRPRCDALSVKPNEIHSRREAIEQLNVNDLQIPGNGGRLLRILRGEIPRFEAKSQALR